MGVLGVFGNSFGGQGGLFRPEKGASRHPGGVRSTEQDTPELIQVAGTDKETKSQFSWSQPAVHFQIRGSPVLLMLF